ncbi:MAG: ATP-dependent RNA helicase HrpA [Bowdeniella nasicola]|nr:ATP-dependent RNA helicase HrpA [Bowdeniella nasicola]
MAASRRKGFRGYTPSQIEERKAAVPTLSYPPELPVSARREDIKRAIASNQVVIVAGATGSGKTTQIPKMCLELGRGITGMIGHTQPRRIAARSVAERICHELDVQLGGAIGYQVRFTDQVGPATLVKLMTDGILLAEIQSDPLLRRYDTIIIDEAHERSLNIDFLLGYLTRLLPSRPDLKLIITSATIDSERFAEHFGKRSPQGHLTPAPVIEVSGRTYPVEIRYRPLEDDSGEPIDQVQGICDAASELMGEGPGDILVFLAGEADIRDADSALADMLGERYLPAGQGSRRGRRPDAVEVLPLYARLSAAEQHRIFQPHDSRRIVLATNVAETSLTVPGIRYVIDPGNARISRFSTRTKVQRLPIEPISQASANQRSGRCGRIEHGIAIRLYSHDDYDARPEFTEPEITRTSLAAVILQMAALGLGAVADFPFVDPPDAKAVRDGIGQLTEIGALKTGGNRPQLTKIGRQLARLPIDPRLGRMVLEAKQRGCASEIVIIVAALSCQDVRERPSEVREAADRFHIRFTDPKSDFLAYLNLWRYLRTQQQLLGSSAFRRLCRNEYLNYLRFREWQDVVRQLQQLSRPLGLRLRPLALPSSREIIDANGDVARACAATTQAHHTAAADSIHQALLVGLLSNIANWDEQKRDYAGTRGTHFLVWPGSGLAKKRYEWVMAAELVETSRLFARTVARIQPEWVVKAGPHLVKRHYSEPVWSRKYEAAMVKETVSLYGLTLVSDKMVPLHSLPGQAARQVAREMFIANALVEGKWRSWHAFTRHNDKALAQAYQLAERTRRLDLVADEQVRAEFFAERIPENVTSGTHFHQWWKRERRNNPDLLTYPRSLLLPDEDTVADEAFPTTWTQGDITLPLSYQFSPGKAADGITITVPAAILGRLQPAAFTWLVPGYLEELCIATIRALPKRIRKHLVPAPATAHTIAGLLPEWADMAAGVDEQGTQTPSFFEIFARLAQQVTGIAVPVDDIDLDRLPAHLRITFRVTGKDGKVVATGDDLAALQRELAPTTRSAVADAVRAAFAKPPPARTSTRAKHPGIQPGGKARVSELAEQENLTDFPAAALPASISTTTAQGLTVRGYPALVPATAIDADRPFAAHLRILADVGEQLARHRAGLIRLVAAKTRLPLERITSRWRGVEAATLAASPYRSTAALVDDAHLAAVTKLVDEATAADVFGSDGPPVTQLRTPEQFRQLVGWVRDRVEDAIYRLLVDVVAILTRHRELESAVKSSNSLSLLHTVQDVRDQAADLVYPGFIAATSPAWLPEIPRYLHAATIRLQRAATNVHADQAAAWQVKELQDEYDQAVSAAAALPLDLQREAAFVEIRWLIEELRVSLFAQQLGTREKVSVKRIRRRLAAL